MFDSIQKQIIILPIVFIISFVFIYISFIHRRGFLLMNGYLIVNQTNSTTSTSDIHPINTFPCLIVTKNSSENSSYIHPMSKDPEASSCYSLKSLAMPEEMIDLNAIAIDRQPIDPSLIPKEVTFNHVHNILYGDPTTNCIYRNARKYINKTYDRSYPHTNINTGEFQEIIKRLDPSIKLQFVVEVGSFTGNSAAIMAGVLKSAHPGSFLLCIDTWLGDLNMWVNKAVWTNLAVTEDGRPTVYYQFLANTLEQNLNDTILPVSMSSVIGARFLHTFQFRPQLIYLDSAHEQGETLIELALYWNILRPGGVIFGDDWNWISVRCDVKKFAYMRQLTIEHLGKLWILTKPLDPVKA